MIDTLKFFAGFEGNLDRLGTQHGSECKILGFFDVVIRTFGKQSPIEVKTQIFLVKFPSLFRRLFKLEQY
jgi:hypothetical protein